MIFELDKHHCKRKYVYAFYTDFVRFLSYPFWNY